VRLITMYVLAKNQGSSFRKVLDHIAKYDSDELVREMAVALGGTAPETTKPTTQPKQPTEPNKPVFQPKQRISQPAKPDRLATQPKQLILQQPAEPNK
jgi:hypothetical protein